MSYDYHPKFNAYAHEAIFAFERYIRGRNGSKPMYLFLEATEHWHDDRIREWFNMEVDKFSTLEAMTTDGRGRIVDAPMRVRISQNELHMWAR